jgi:hypothetical protein
MTQAGGVPLKGTYWKAARISHQARRVAEPAQNGYSLIGPR